MHCTMCFPLCMDSHDHDRPLESVSPCKGRNLFSDGIQSLANQRADFAVFVCCRPPRFGPFGQKWEGIPARGCPGPQSPGSTSNRCDIGLSVWLWQYVHQSAHEHLET